MTFENRVNHDNIYWGNKQAHPRILGDLASDLSNTPGIYIVRGGSRAGKTTIIKDTFHQLEQNGFLRIQGSELDTFLDTFNQHANLYCPLNKYNCKLCVKRLPSEHYVLSLSNEVFLPSNRETVEKIISAQRQFSGAMAILLESPFRYAPPFPGTQKPEIERLFYQEKQGFSELINAHPEIRVFHLPYDAQQIKETLWEHRHEKIELYVDLLGVDTKTAEWQSVFTALQKAKAINPEDSVPYKILREQYDRAFERVRNVEYLAI